MAQRSAQDGISMMQAADDVETIQKAINELIEGIDGIVNNSEFNGVKLLK